VVAGCVRERKVVMKEVQEGWRYRGLERGIRRYNGTSVGGVVAGCVWESLGVEGEDEGGS
jgi:hypothetical protein